MSEDSKEPFIMLPRSFFCSASWTKRRAFSEAECLLDMASIASRTKRTVLVRGKKIDLGENEFVGSSRFLAHRWKCSKPTVLRLFSMLKKLSALQIRSVFGETIIWFDFEKFCGQKNADFRDTGFDTGFDTNLDTGFDTTFDETSDTASDTGAEDDKNFANGDKQGTCGCDGQNGAGALDTTSDTNPQIFHDTASDTSLDTAFDTASVPKTNNYNIEELLRRTTYLPAEESLLRVVRILKPRAQGKRTPKELRAWKNLKHKPSVQEINLVRWFYAQEKSKDFDETWRRKRDTATLINNWQDMVEIATAFCERKAAEEHSGAKKNNPPAFDETERADAASDFVSFSPRGEKTQGVFGDKFRRKHLTEADAS